MVDLVRLVVVLALGAVFVVYNAFVTDPPAKAGGFSLGRESGLRT